MLLPVCLDHTMGILSCLGFFFFPHYFFPPLGYTAQISMHSAKCIGVKRCWKSRVMPSFHTLRVSLAVFPSPVLFKALTGLGRCQHQMLHAFFPTSLNRHGSFSSIPVRKREAGCIVVLQSWDKLGHKF